MPAYAVSHKGSGFQTTRSAITIGHGMEPKSIWTTTRGGGRCGGPQLEGEGLTLRPGT